MELEHKRICVGQLGRYRTVVDGYKIVGELVGQQPDEHNSVVAERVELEADS